MERWSRFGIAAAALLWAVAAYGPGFLDPAELRLASRIMILGLLAMSLNLLVGNTGIVSFGHGLFYGTGSYAVSLLALHKGWAATTGLLLGPVFAAVFAAIGGLIAFRARRLYFGLLTLAISQFGFVLATQWYSLTQGENGIHGVEMPDWLLTTNDKYRFIFIVFTVALVAIRVLLASPFGTTLRAVRENRDRVAFLGVHAIRYEYAAFVISGAFAGLAGSLLVVLDQNSFPQLFHWTTSAEPLLMIIIGGAGTFFGPLLGAAVVVYVQDYLRSITDNVNLLYGIVVLVIALLAPGGLTGIGKSLVFGGPRALLERVRKPSASPHTSEHPEPEVDRTEWDTPEVDATR